MTEHLNQRFKDVLAAMNDPNIPTEGIVFHSIRHTSVGLKLKLSKGDVKAVQGDGGWNTPDMVTKRYAHILDQDRKNLASEMEASFYREGVMSANPTPVRNPAPSQAAPPIVDVNALAALQAKDTSLLAKVLQSIQFANNP